MTSPADVPPADAPLPPAPAGPAEALAEVRAEIAAAAREARRDPSGITLVAVSKTVPAEAIRPALEAGQRVFGENYVQESAAKWPALREACAGVELHLVGPLQSNKAKEAVALFDVIHSLDRDSLAAALAKEMQKQGRRPALLVQVNTGAEPQKAGLLPQDVPAFLDRLRDTHGLTPQGLMCIPPAEEPPAPHFALLDDLARRHSLPWRSMGMSADFDLAIRFGATHVRVGTRLFGARAPKA